MTLTLSLPSRTQDKFLNVQSLISTSQNITNNGWKPKARVGGRIYDLPITNSVWQGWCDVRAYVCVITPICSKLPGNIYALSIKVQNTWEKNKVRWEMNKMISTSLLFVCLKISVISEKETLEIFNEKD